MIILYIIYNIFILLSISPTVYLYLYFYTKYFAYLLHMFIQYIFEHFHICPLLFIIIYYLYYLVILLLLKHFWLDAKLHFHCQYFFSVQ